MKIIPRSIPNDSVSVLLQAKIHPLLAQLYAARGVCSADELDDAPGDEGGARNSLWRGDSGALRALR